MYIKVENLSQLKTGEYLECFISLKGGIKSVKYIQYTNNKFYIENAICGSMQILTEEELFDSSKTLIGQAFNLGSLYYNQEADF